MTSNRPQQGNIREYEKYIDNLEHKVESLIDRVTTHELKARSYEKQIKSLREQLEERDNFVRAVAEWKDYYPPNIFTEPTPKELDDVCKTLGFRIDRISAMVLRVVSANWSARAKEILEKGAPR